MQHHPRAVRLVQAHLDEVVAAAERAELVHPARFLADTLLHARMTLHDAPQPLVEALRGMRARVAVLVALEPHWHVAGNLVEHFPERALVELVAGEREPPRDHAAA